MNRIEVGTEPFTEEERLKRMREAFDMLLARKPVAVILVADLGDQVGSLACGSMIDILALTSVLPDLTQQLLNKVPDPEHNE